jgi:hypothetical protein
MRSPRPFFRYYGAAGTVPPGAKNPLLGSDSAPSPLADGDVAPTYPTPLPLVGQDNVLEVRNVTNQGGFPQKIAVGYGYVGAGSAPALTATMYALEEATGLWYLVGTAHTALVAGGFVFFDALTTADGPPFGGGSVPGGNIAANVGVGQSSSGKYVLVVDLVGTTAGQYYFSMTPILTTSP